MSLNEAEVKERKSYEVPGVGELMARPGTSTAELAGAASFWYKKYQTAYSDGAESARSKALKDGFIAATTLIAALEFAAFLIYHWSH
jgi:hypothetical protein